MSFKKYFSVLQEAWYVRFGHQIIMTYIYNLYNIYDLYKIIHVQRSLQVGFLHKLESIFFNLAIFLSWSSVQPPLALMLGATVTEDKHYSQTNQKSEFTLSLSKWCCFDPQLHGHGSTRLKVSFLSFCLLTGFPLH